MYRASNRHDANKPCHKWIDCQNPKDESPFDSLIYLLYTIIKVIKSFRPERRVV